MFKLIVAMEISDDELPVLVLGIRPFRIDIISHFPLLLHACTYMKSIFLDFVCRKGIPFIKKKSIAVYTFWLCFAMLVGMGILGIILCCSGLLLMALTCMMGICDL